MLTTGEWCDPSQQDVTPYEKRERLSGEGIGCMRFEISSSVWNGIPRYFQRLTVEVTQETWVVPRRRRAAIGICPLLLASYDMQGKRWAHSTPRPQGGNMSMNQKKSPFNS